jgi:hypothetical protein
MDGLPPALDFVGVARAGQRDQPATVEAGRGGSQSQVPPFRSFATDPSARPGKKGAR